jgi:hypothetical protein
MEQKHIDRFNIKILKTDTCWEWTAVCDRYGYGIFRLDSKNAIASRISYSINKGDPTGWQVLHTCDNRKCVNPSHLYLGTHQDNMKDKKERDRANKGKGFTDEHRKNISIALNRWAKKRG